MTDTKSIIETTKILKKAYSRIRVFMRAVTAAETWLKGESEEIKSFRELNKKFDALDKKIREDSQAIYKELQSISIDFGPAESQITAKEISDLAGHNDRKHLEENYRLVKFLQGKIKERRDRLAELHDTILYIRMDLRDLKKDVDALYVQREALVRIINDRMNRIGENKEDAYKIVRKMKLPTGIGSLPFLSYYTNLVHAGGEIANQVQHINEYLEMQNQLLEEIQSGTAQASIGRTIALCTNSLDRLKEIAGDFPVGNRGSLTERIEAFREDHLDSENPRRRAYWASLGGQYDAAGIYMDYLQAYLSGGIRPTYGSQSTVGHVQNSTVIPAIDARFSMNSDDQQFYIKIVESSVVPHEPDRRQDKASETGAEGGGPNPSANDSSSSEAEGGGPGPSANDSSSSEAEGGGPGPSVNDSSSSEAEGGGPGVAEPPG